jgi:hypothetical protein
VGLKFKLDSRAVFDIDSPQPDLSVELDLDGRAVACSKLGTPKDILEPQLEGWFGQQASQASDGIF